MEIFQKKLQDIRTKVGEYATDGHLSKEESADIKLSLQELIKDVQKEIGSGAHPIYEEIKEVALSATKIPRKKTEKPPENKNNELPLGETVDGMPGYVRTPFTNPRRLIVAHGYKPGSEMICPYTQKKFRIPADFKDAQLFTSTSIEIRKHAHYSILWKRGGAGLEQKVAQIEAFCERHKQELQNIQEIYGRPLTLLIVQKENWNEVIGEGLSGNIIKEGVNKGKAIWTGEQVNAWNYFDISSTLEKHFGQKNTTKPMPGIIFKAEQEKDFGGTFSNEFFESYIAALFHQASPDNHMEKPWEEIAPMQIMGLRIDMYFEGKESIRFDELINFINSPTQGLIPDADNDNTNNKTAEQTYQEFDRANGNYFYQDGIPSDILDVINNVLRQKIAKYIGKKEGDIPITFFYDKKTELLVAKQK